MTAHLLAPESLGKQSATETNKAQWRKLIRSQRDKSTKKIHKKKRKKLIQNPCQILVVYRKKKKKISPNDVC